MSKVIIFVEDGVVHNAYSNDPELIVIVQDQDNIDSGDEPLIPKKDMDRLHELGEDADVLIKEGYFRRVY